MVSHQLVYRYDLDLAYVESFVGRLSGLPRQSGWS